MKQESRRSFIRNSTVLVTGIATGAGSLTRTIKAQEASNDISSEYFQFIQTGNLDQLQRLVAAQPGLIGAKNEHGRSGFAVALLNEQAKVAEWLSKAGYQPDVHECALALDWDRLDGLAKETGNRISIEINRQHAIGGTAMYAAAVGGAGTDIWRVYAQGARPNEFTDGVTPLQAALRYRDLETAELTAATLLTNSTDPNKAGDSDLPPLHIAANRGSYDLVEMMIRLGANVDRRDPDGKTALDRAEEGENESVARLLENASSIQRTFRCNEQRNRDGDPIKLDRWQDISVIERSRFVGLSHSNLDAVKTNLQARPQLAHSIATTGERAVEAGAHMGNRSIVDVLLEAGAPYSLPTAVMMGDIDSAKRMLGQNPDRIQERGAHDFALLWYPIIGNNNVEMMSLLFDHGADVEQQSQMGTTALHWASMGSNVKMVELLIGHGADVNRVGRKFGGKRLTPLQMARDAKMVDLLKSKGAKLKS